MLKRLKRTKIAGAEGFGPVYDSSGKIEPGFEGLGPTYYKDLGPMIKVPKTPKTPKTPHKSTPPKSRVPKGWRPTTGIYA